jgi:hypothetical protein
MIGVHATITVEKGVQLRMDSGSWKMGSSEFVRVVPHVEKDGKLVKPRGKAGQGVSIVPKDDETVADVLAMVGEILAQNQYDWHAFTRMFEEARR